MNTPYQMVRSGVRWSPASGEVGTSGRAGARVDVLATREQERRRPFVIDEGEAPWWKSGSSRSRSGRRRCRQAPRRRLCRRRVPPQSQRRAELPAAMRVAGPAQLQADRDRSGLALAETPGPGQSYSSPWEGQSIRILAGMSTRLMKRWTSPLQGRTESTARSGREGVAENPAEVWSPSGSALTTAPIKRVPPAPPRFSTMMD